jgi:hypothetical protein
MPPSSPPSSSGGLVDWVKSHKLISGVVGAILLIIIISTTASPTPSEQDAEASPSSASSPTVATPAASSSSASSTPSPSPSPSQTKADKPDKPVTYSGSGDRILGIKKPSGKATEPVAVTASYTGGSNFVIWSLNRNLKEDQLLVNTIGSYTGTVPLDFEKGQATTKLKIEGSGTWKLVIKPLLSMRHFRTSIKGTGDEVLFYTGHKGVANISYKGNENFVVWFYGNGDLLVNEIGTYKGQQIIDGGGPGFVTIDADSGTWSITVT